MLDRTGNLSIEKDLTDIKSSGNESIPLTDVCPKRSAAFFRSASNSRCLSLNAFALGSRISSSSKLSSSSSPAARLAVFSASFSASFCLSVPFFFGGATGAAAGFSSSLSDDFSQSLCPAQRLFGYRKIIELTTGPSSSSSSPCHLFADFFGAIFTAGAAGVSLSEFSKLLNAMSMIS
jgi:hypothetical protein